LDDSIVPEREKEAPLYFKKVRIPLSSFIIHPSSLIPHIDIGDK